MVNFLGKPCACTCNYNVTGLRSQYEYKRLNRVVPSVSNISHLVETIKFDLSLLGYDFNRSGPEVDLYIDEPGYPVTSFLVRNKVKLRILQYVRLLATIYLIECARAT